MLKANDDIMPKEERSSIIDQMIGNQQIHFPPSYYCYLLWLYCGVCTLKPVMLVISCTRATHLTSKETLPPLTIFQAMKIDLFLI